MAYSYYLAGNGYATLLPSIDFETYSEAGYYFDSEAARPRWRLLPGTPSGTTSGLAAVGAPNYAAHPSTEVISLAYDLRDGLGERLWLPVMPPPRDLLDHVQRGGLLQAWNSSFEWYIWNWVCTKRYGWPELPLDQLRCAMAKAAAFGYPGQLDAAAKASHSGVQKQEDGQRLIKKFSVPHTPTKKDPRHRITIYEDVRDGQRFLDYNAGDIRAESAVGLRCPDLDGHNLELWQLDQRINTRGVQIDRDGMNNCLAIVDQANEIYNAELAEITNGAVKSANELQALQGWLAGRGVYMENMQAETIEKALEEIDPFAEPECRALEIRHTLASASVRKLRTMARRLSNDGRMRDLFRFRGARQTGRFAGQAVQPQNLPGSGPKVRRCDPVSGCGRHYRYDADACPWCGASNAFSESGREWGLEAAQDALDVIALRCIHTLRHYFGDPVAAVSGCLRALFVAAPGHELICSDYAAIEAVVLAALAGEEWRLEVFRTHGMIYETSAAKITGMDLQEFIDYKRKHGEHHPLRKKLGKVAELASGYEGWIGAWLAFGAGEYFESDQEIKRAILAWREASPMIVEFWGGQVRKHPHRWEWWHDLHGLEGAAVMAIRNPGQAYQYRDISYQMAGDILYCRLPSGRCLKYHEPRLTPKVCSRSGLDVFRITYMTWNSDSTKGPIGWVRMETYGGKLAENVTQAVAADILTHAMVNLDRAGFRIVLHVHDEIVAEIPAGSRSIAEFEAIMGQLPQWCADWPVKAAGGWTGPRFRKD